MMSPQHKLRAAPRGGVILTDPALAARVRVNRTYLMSLDNQNLLQNFLLEAGRLSIRIYNFDDAFDKYHWGWEAPTCQLRGHFLGHWLSAAAQRCQAVGDDELKAKAEAVVAELAECQKDNGGEWAGSVPEKYLDWIARGKKVWAPHYCLHKTLMGLVDMARCAGSELALEVLVNWAKWFTRWSTKFDDEAWADVLDVETGGMMEAWADLYELTGREEHLALMKRYERKRLFEPLLAGEDVLTNRHANTTIPEIHGAARAYELTGERRWRDICEAYWDFAVTRRGFYCTGGQTSGEVWTPMRSIRARLSDVTQEHCVVYNMIRLADFLLRWTGEAAYADYIERNRINGLLAQQQAGTGMVAYFLPLRGGSRKDWSTPKHAFTCCLGTVVQANAHHADWIHYEDDDGLTVAQYVPSRWALRRGEANVDISVEPAGTDPGYNPLPSRPETDHRPMADRYVVRVESDRPAEFALRLRLPWWLSGPAEVAVDDGPAESIQRGPDGWHAIRRTWHHDTVRIDLPKALTACPMPDAPEMVAYMEGPTVLAGLVDSERTLTGDPARPEEFLVPDDERQWGRWFTRYQTRGQEGNFRLVPLNEIDDQTYTVYFEIRPHDRP
jgi:DUF1680 family protein